MDSVLFVQGRNRGTFPFCNSYIVKDRGDLVLIDPQCGLENLERGLDLLGCSFSDVSAVLTTHFHVDHTTPCRWLSEQFDIPIFMHVRDAPAVAS